MKNIKNTIPLPLISYNIRFSQAIAPFGVGAMIDFKDQTLMVAAPEYWTVNQSQEIHDERLERLLNVEKFCLPPDKNQINKIPFVRFPRWYFCPKCKRLKSLESWKKEFKPSLRSKNLNMITPKCMECNMQLVPAGIVVTCEDGHIDDFPWVEWVHGKSGGVICDKDHSHLKIENASSALGLEGLVIKCTKCSAKANMKGAFSPKIFDKYIKENYKCTGNMPWKGKKEKCNQAPKTVQRGALNIYFAKVISSIVIPPYSSEINLLVKQSNKFSLLLEMLQDEDYVKVKGKQKIIDLYIEKIANDIHRDKNVVKIILYKTFNNDDSNIETKEQYRIEEYNALIGNIPKECMEEQDFKIEIQKNIDEYNIYGLSKVTLVKKLREVRALVGFSRLQPIEADLMSGFESDNYANGFVSVKEKETNWYPAYEARGEGIFIELNKEIIEEWIEKNSKVSERIEILNLRYNEIEKKRGNKPRPITPKFVLLHTFAHIIMKELSFECGYDSASLTERIYCNTDENSTNMNGILIYTSSGDSEGTLGGLVRQGKSDMLPRIIVNAVRKAMWCSSDPVCIDSKGQGRDGLNLSACHACALISETSCEEFNVLLDRALIVGELEDKEIGFFNKIFDEE
ncbi:DUF1998 domain-containing protein [Clostridium botulinum]|uniref:DUF1998 domain-containing protein n=1 Tax=Clostridium botulinum TaxID=1491 RepID=UPI0013C6DC6D|nr:DUF1998 domain-containing protein [Clostridium botulinum]MBY7024812.1 DUF1998 domain-containing protein [Clostridium botulinum]NFN19711.1 DUF1998 domain-containing protein [Clostridium botulinum]NFN50108.1 DUF1998 domain-containing protein [Clostridium botulinum]